MHNNITPMPTQTPWAWVDMGMGTQCRALLLYNAAYIIRYAPPACHVCAFSDQPPPLPPPAPPLTALWRPGDQSWVGIKLHVVCLDRVNYCVPSISMNALEEPKKCTK